MCSVVTLRAPSMIRSQTQRPLLYLLTVFAISTLIVQTWFAKTINEITGIAQLNYLLQGLWGVLNAAMAWEVTTQLADRNNQRRARRRVRLTMAVIAAVSMKALFAATWLYLRFTL